MKSKKWNVGLGITSVAALTMMLAGCGAKTGGGNQSNGTSGSGAHSNFKVGLVTDTGGLNDHGFNHLSDVGLVKAEKQLGVTGNVVSSKSASDYVSNLTTFAQKHYNLVIAVGYLMDSAVKQVSKEYPKTKFLIIDDSITGIPNVTGALFKTEQCGYLAGVMAGMMEKQGKAPRLNSKNILGVVGGQKIPPVTSYIAGFQQGVKKVDSGATILVKYANSFSDQAKGSEIAQSEISNGADIVFQVAGATGIGVIKAAQKAKVYAIGVDANQNYLAPKTVITSATKGVDTATYDVIKQALDGKFKSGDQYFDLSNNGVGLAPANSAVPKSIVSQVQKYRSEIKSGKITVSAKLQ
ncbi:BMP family ABC transporter substrate-binding protein [Alicyclobacillus sp. SO9]|nr:BMP family ABC transporter substrate-binding protein [Alicyclobacillus sp. SO9]